MDTYSIISIKKIVNY